MSIVSPTRSALRTWVISLACGVAAGLLGAGCTATGKNAIPLGSDRVASGTGTIEYRAQRDGDMWVYDTDSHKMVYTGPVRDGERIRVNTGSNQITVGGRTVSERPLSGEHKYEIYFRRPQ